MQNRTLNRTLFAIKIGQLGHKIIKNRTVRTLLAKKIQNFLNLNEKYKTKKEIFDLILKK